jgi:hypothetical protein
MRTIALCWLLLVATLAARADSGEEQVPVGPRPLAMGGAYTAIAQGADAISWNPAGLGLLRVSTTRITQADLYGLGIQDNVFTLAAPMFDSFGFGLEWYHSGYDQDGLSDRLNRFALAGGWDFARRISFGVSLKYRSYQQAYESVDEGRGSGVGLDLGALVFPHSRVSLGATWNDVGGSTLRYDDGTRIRPYDSYLSLGAAFEAYSSLTLAASVDRDAHAGFEWRALGPLELRGGFSKDLDGLQGPRVSAGIGVRYGPACLDYAFQDHPMLDITHRFGLSFDFTLAPRLVEIREAHMDPLFASFYKSYAVDAPGELVLHSLSDEPVELTVRVSQPELMLRPTQIDYFVLPGVSQRISLPLILKPGIVELNENRPLAFEVEIVYQSSGRRRTETRQISPMVYGAGLLSWGTGVDRAAAFITPNDDVVDTFTRSVLRATVEQPRALLRNRTATLGARLFDGLSACGLSYAPDPLNPFGSVQGQDFAVDDIQYPAQLLRRRTGDCDDSTVLYASMLANVGIRTVLLDVPGHVFLMFDTRIPARERDRTGVRPELFVVHEGSLWIPVETTSLGQPFHVAWQRGADLFHENERAGHLGMADTQNARRRFEPALAGVPESGTVPEVDPAELQRYLSSDITQLETMRMEFMQEFERRQRDIGDVTALTALARLYHRYDELQPALEILESISEPDASVWNNLGNIRLALGDGEGALVSYDRARELDASDPGILLNRGVALHFLERDEEAMAALMESVTKSEGLEGAMDLLAVRRSPDEGSRGVDVIAMEEMALQSVEQLMRQAVRSIGADGADGAAVSTGAGPLAEASQSVPGVGAATDSTQTGVDSSAPVLAASEGNPSSDPSPVGAFSPTASLLREARIEPSSLAEILYWKEPAQP